MSYQSLNILCESVVFFLLVAGMDALCTATVLAAGILLASASNLNFPAVPSEEDVAASDTARLTGCLVDCSWNPTNLLFPFHGEHACSPNRDMSLSFPYRKQFEQSTGIFSIDRFHSNNDFDICAKVHCHNPTLH
jgi:hypothetical protein